MDDGPMAHFHRTFLCKRCGKEAELERLHGVSVIISCDVCDVHELWNTEDTLPSLLIFSYTDQKMAEA